MRRRGLLGLPSALAAPLRLLVLLALLPVTRAIYTLEMFRQPSEAVAGLPFGVQLRCRALRRRRAPRRLVM